jgi:hypothetical protein
MYIIVKATWQFVTRSHRYKSPITHYSAVHLLHKLHSDNTGMFLWVKMTVRQHRDVPLSEDDRQHRDVPLSEDDSPWKGCWSVIGEKCCLELCKIFVNCFVFKHFLVILIDNIPHVVIWFTNSINTSKCTVLCNMYFSINFLLHVSAQLLSSRSLRQCC